MRKARSFHFVNKQQPGDWHPASLGVWWNKCILIRTETWRREVDLQPNRTSELWGGIFFFLPSFSFLSRDRLIFLLSAGRRLVVVSLHSTTLQNTPSWGWVQQLSHSLLSVSLTGRALLYKVLKAHKFCKFNKSTLWVWYLTGSRECCQYFQSTIPGQELDVPKKHKTHDCQWVSESSFILGFVSSAEPSVTSVGMGVLILLQSSICVRRTESSLFFPTPPFPVSPSWQWRLTQRHLPPGRILRYCGKALSCFHITVCVCVCRHVNVCLCVNVCVCVRT